MTAWVAGDFVARAIPSMDEYCQKRVSIWKVVVWNHWVLTSLQYGEQWTEVRKKVPYKLLPWIY